MPTLDDDDRRRLSTTVTASGGTLTGATLALEVAGATHPMQWTSEGDTERTGQTVGCLAGPSATPQVGDITLTPGRYAVQVIVALADGQVIAGASQTLWVGGGA